MNDEMGSEAQSQAGPTSLEEAMRTLRAGDQPSTDAAVGDAGMVQGAEPTEPEGAEAQSGTEGNIGPATGIDAGRSSADNLDAGGSPVDSGVAEESVGEIDDEPQYDYQQIGRSYLQSAQRLAIDAANQKFRNEGIKKVSINDLYERDDRGRVSFTNPDDPDHPFSSRAEAQQWCDSFNNQIDQEWRRTAYEFQGQYAKEIQPVLRLMEFAPNYDTMSKQEQNVFDKIVNEYVIKDSYGMAIGYSCDLNQAMQMAKNIASDFSSPDQAQSTSSGQQGQALQGGGPALDAQTSTSTNPQNDAKGPKTLAEAIKMVQDNKKESRKN